MNSQGQKADTRGASASEHALAPGLLLTYYGDDFTGSTDELEVLSAAGLPTLLCLQAPTPELLAKWPGLRCIGLAGTARSRSPAWMDEHLPGALQSLAALGAPLLHYKLCSTFDSSPTTGSIGRATEIGTRVMAGSRWSPTIVGAPRLKRYQAFGNLFAAVDGTAHRLDRHPSMSRHPVTPMHESDLRLHLRQQTHRRIELIDLVALKTGLADTQLAKLLAGDAPSVLLDVLDEQTLQAAGRLVWQNRGQGLFSASSSGLAYALVAHWREQGWLPAQASLPPAKPVAAIAAVSGSCSPVTAAQIQWAAAHGFATERLNIAQALDAHHGTAEIERCVSRASEALRHGQSTIVYSAQGPDDPAVLGFDATAKSAGLGRSEAAQRIGLALAQVMNGLLERVALPRIAVAGGDSSGEVASALGIQALQAVATLEPGAPLCAVSSDTPGREGLQVVLKGGQMGSTGFFGAALKGVFKGA